MEREPDSKLLRIFIGENDKLDHKLLYEAILFKAFDQKMAGCTVMKGMMSFGAGSIVHTAKLIAISEDLPIVVEIVDKEERINDFKEVANAMIEEAGCGGLITIEKALVLHYRHRKK